MRRVTRWLSMKHLLKRLRLTEAGTKPVLKTGIESGSSRRVSGTGGP
jgi:hypothetical protein